MIRVVVIVAPVIWSDTIHVTVVDALLPDVTVAVTVAAVFKTL